VNTNLDVPLINGIVQLWDVFLIEVAAH
jgi:hypothetical protein